MLSIKCKIQAPQIHEEKKDNSVYYKNFDFVNFRPLDLIAKPEYLPYIKVYPDTSRISKIEVYRKNRKVPDKIYLPINIDSLVAYKIGSLVAYKSFTRLKGCMTVDTLISFNGNLIEFRACYSNISNTIIYQDIFYYRNISPDSISFDWISLYNLADKPRLVQKVDPNIIFNNITTSSKVRGSYIMYKTDNNSMKVKCVSFDNEFCLSGAEERERYPFSDCLYWSLFYYYKWLTR